MGNLDKKGKSKQWWGTAAVWSLSVKFDGESESLLNLLCRDKEVLRPFNFTNDCDYVDCVSTLFIRDLNTKNQGILITYFGVKLSLMKIFNH